VTEPIVGVLIGQWAALDDLLAGLSDAEWEAETCLPGWRVRDVAAHLIGTESQLAGDTPPVATVDVHSLPYVHNDLAAANELWVQAFRPESPAAMLARFREVTSRRTKALEAMTEAEFDAPSWTPAGPGTYRRFMDFRLFDCWCHDQDIRDAVGRPGHETGPSAERAVDQIAGALGYLVGKRAGAPEGAAVTVELTGPVCRELHVVVDGRARVVDALDRPATTTIRLSSRLFVRLAGGRVDPAGYLAEVGITGDAELGRRVVGNLNFTP
jgi:uncharacterized protein (TIGR03083 family)